MYLFLWFIILIVLTGFLPLGINILTFWGLFIGVNLYRLHKLKEEDFQ
jgi:hypothetical protein